MLRPLADFLFNRGYASSDPKLLGDTSVMSDGSENIVITGTGKNEVFKGVTAIGGVTGSKVLFNAGDDYAGLGDHAETAIGSVFKVLGALFFIGAGKLYWKGIYQTASASTTLALKKFTAGVLGTTYQAGLAQPSAPTIRAVTPPSGFTGKNNGAVSVKTARVRSQTGGVSNASPSSNIVQCTNQSVAVTFALADSNGQDYWEIDVTKNGEGGLGNTFYLAELAESVLTETVTANATTDADTTIGLPNGTLTAAHIGWQYSSSGDTTTYVTAVGGADSHSAGKQQITLNAASVLSTTQSATFTRAVEGVLRTYVFEWRDADLAGADLAPTRNFPPPAGVCGGVSGDVVFVDGCYGDTVNVTAQTDAQTGQPYSASNAGNAIAVSDPSKPESYPPDNYIFTGDSPVVIVPGGEGVHWRWARNSLGVIRYIGGSPALSYEKVWSGIGIAAPHNQCLGAGGRVYAFTGARGLVRLGANGEPDTQFAARISDDLATATPADVVLVYDANHQYVLVAYQRKIWCYYESESLWTPPQRVTTGMVGSANIKAGVTVNGAAYLAYSTGAAIGLYNFNVDNGSVTGKINTAWIPSQDVTDVVQQIIAAIRTDNTTALQVKLYANGDAATAVRTFSVTPTTGFQTLLVGKANYRGCKSWRVSIEIVSNGGDTGIDMLRVNGISSQLFAG